MTSLRTRLLLGTLGVAVIAVATVALLSRRATLVEFERFQTVTRGSNVDRHRAGLERHFRERGGWSGVTSLLEAIAESEGGAAVLADPQSAVVAAAPPVGPLDRLTISPTHRIERRSEDGGRGRRVVIEHPPMVALTDAAGDAIGTLYVLPAPTVGELDPREMAADLFVGSITRSLMLAVLAAGLAALGLTVMLGRRIVRPIEALTHAARRMEAGDLAQRVDTASRDEIGALAQAFNAMAQRLAHTETLRRHLVNDVAHELRTPLTNIRCQLEAVQDGLLTPGRETLESLHHEVMLLSRLVDDLQDLALAEAGQLRLDRTAVPVAALMATAAASLAPQAAARGVSLTSAPVAADLQVQADPQRLGQVLRNLIVNAITHTPAGGSIAIAAQSAPAQVAISVTDTGTGIAAEHLPHIFERFYRTDRSRTRATGGAGLGLAIVRQLVETQGGRVSVDSVVDRGSTFTVMLPRADSPGTPAPLPAPAPLGD